MHARAALNEKSDAEARRVCIDRFWGSEHNCMYVNPVEVRQAQILFLRRCERPGWRQNIYL